MQQQKKLRPGFVANGESVHAISIVCCLFRGDVLFVAREPRLMRSNLIRASESARALLEVPEPYVAYTVLGTQRAFRKTSTAEEVKPVLLCLHAIGHGRNDFGRVESKFAETVRLISFDWPGPGHSGTDTHQVSAQRDADLLAGLLQQLNVSHLAVLATPSLARRQFFLRRRTPNGFLPSFWQTPKGLTQVADS